MNTDVIGDLVHEMRETRDGLRDAQAQQPTHETEQTIAVLNDSLGQLERLFRFGMEQANRERAS